MGRVVIHPSPGVARLLQARREHMGLSLREASARTAACGPAIPFQTLAKIETGKTDPGLRRIYRPVITAIRQGVLHLSEEHVAREDLTDAGELSRTHRHLGR